ncbi:uncharacterized protein LOC121736518 [Aricia agestis]|uniref:uncharacterized protein LOC121727356 n=1 Tax=Aricia agestis TaxID=91739 RepID=UPI001C205C20|nr:uncharacterized protein LOC121727356 [Aricia agestis]XP_041983696.1 uncharacterized protein LOC121736518 [Aricia agestis]
MTESTEQSRPTTSELAAITLTTKIPDFWTDHPKIWFIRTEAMLAPQKLSDETKYDIVVSKLSREVIQQVTDILIDPPAVKKFDTLKARLLQIYEESENRQLQKLISEMELGDQKPSQLLRRMRELAKDKIPNETLRLLWQGHLPGSTRAVLAVTETKDLDALARIADNVLESSRSMHQINEVVHSPSPSTSRDADLIMAEIAKLSMKVADLDRRTQERYSRPWNRNFRPNNNRSRSRNRSAPRRTPEDPDWLCRYHNRFGSRARTCEEPCAWRRQQEN